MWHVLGCFAPRPLCISQGDGDPLFPCDLFHNVARRVRHVYRSVQTESALRAQVVRGGHSWDTLRIELLTEFLEEEFDLSSENEAFDQGRLLADDGLCLEGWPDHAVTIDQLAQQLTWRIVPANLCL
jgi:hypothetical protein